MFKDSNPDYYPGTRVLVYDTRKKERRPAKVLSWYGKTSNTRAGGSRFGPYESLIDVWFEHDQRVSKAHFADSFYVDVLNSPRA